MEIPTIEIHNYAEIKRYYDTVLNKDKSLVKTSNDEPTPISCVEEMVEKIPEDFWKQTNLKILDPCCGCGNFPFVVYHKLIKYHSRETILKDILHFNDLNLDRINVLKKLFCYENLNIFTTDFLKFEPTIKFDLIMANPPYAKLNDNGKRTAKNHNLIGLFINKSLELLVDHGLLLYITPDNWMSYANRNTLIQKLTKLQIVHINIHTAKRYFPKVGSSFVWYLIENTNYYKDISVEGVWKGNVYQSMVQSEERKYIPLYYNQLVQSIVRKTIDNRSLKKFNVETTSFLHKYTKRECLQSEKDENHPFRLIHTPKQIVWSSKKHKYQDGWKVFIPTTSYFKTFIDNNCGMTQSIAFIRCNDEEEARKINKVLSHPLYKFLNDICRYGNFNNIRILQSFPYSINYDDIYNQFGITEEEQRLIA
jgi:adenine-specific DNA-methyltransferase